MYDTRAPAQRRDNAFQMYDRRARALTARIFDKCMTHGRAHLINHTFHMYVKCARNHDHHNDFQMYVTRAHPPRRKNILQMYDTWSCPSPQTYFSNL